MAERRTQAQRSAHTHAALVEAGRHLFAERGFSGVSSEELAAAAGVSTGALYHQFHSKRDLFLAVFEAVEAAANETIALAAAKGSDALDRLLQGCLAFLQISSEPEYRRIVLLEGRAVLGWDAWQEVMLRHGLGTTTAAIEFIIKSGLIPPYEPTALAHVFRGALDAGAVLIAESADPESARADVAAVISGLANGLRAGPA